MTSAFDDRLVTVGITIEGKTYTFNQDYYIMAAGEKLGSPNMGTGTLRIDNINKDLRNFLLTKTSPWVQQENNQAPILPLITLDVGRKSYGTFRLFQANAIACAPTQPPDIGLIFRTMQGVALLGQPLVLTMPAITLLSQIAQRTATNLGLALDFQATDRQINNFSFTGTSYRQIQKLAECGNVDVFIDNSSLVVKNSGTPRKGAVPLISKETGMIGVPVVTERGVLVRTLINNEVQIGGAIKIQSQINPAANGQWYVYRLGFEIASRDTPFYWNIEGNLFRLGYTP